MVVYLFYLVGRCDWKPAKKRGLAAQAGKNFHCALHDLAGEGSGAVPRKIYMGGNASSGGLPEGLAVGKVESDPFAPSQWSLDLPFARCELPEVAVFQGEQVAVESSKKHALHGYALHSLTGRVARWVGLPLAVA